MGPRITGPEDKVKRIVILTDDAKTKRTIRAALANPDCELLECADPERALDGLSRSGVACLLVDCNVPGVSREMMHLIQYSAGMAAVPVLWMSNYGERDPVARELQVTPLNILAKPFGALQLLQRIQECFWLGPCLPANVPVTAIRLA